MSASSAPGGGFGTHGTAHQSRLSHRVAARDGRTKFVGVHAPVHSRTYSNIPPFAMTIGLMSNQVDLTSNSQNWVVAYPDIRMVTVSVKKNDMQARWEAAHQLPRFRPAYPHEQVVRWAFRELSRAAVPKTKVLDVGCGAGRHSLFLAGEGFDTYACDISSVGLSELRSAAQRKGLTVTTCQTPAQDLSRFPDASMEGALCFAVIYYLSLGEAEHMIREVFRVLRPGGKFLCVTRSDADSRRQNATPIGRCAWHLTALGPDAPSTMEEDMDMLFFSREDIERMFRSFEKVCIDRMTYTHLGFVDDDWVINAVKA